jgi:hypothetical protein
VDYRILLGVAAVAVGLVGFIPYFWDILHRRTKPHAFSWLIWALIVSVTFFAALSKGGGIGECVVGGTALACFLVFVTALFRGEKEIVLLDKLSLAAALMGILFWAVTNNPLNAVMIAVLVDAIGWVPTFRKAYKKPHEETLSMYALSGIGFAISLFALQAVNATTVLYPAYAVVANLAFVAMAMARRRRPGAIPMRSRKS